MNSTKAELLEHIFGTKDYVSADQMYTDYVNNVREVGVVGDTKLVLPYQAPNYALPSIKEISEAMSTHSLRCRPGYFPSQFMVCKVGSYFVKQGRDIRVLKEAETLLWLEQHTQVRVPKLIAAFQLRLVYDDQGHFRESPDGRLTNFLVTEWLEGLSMNDDEFDALSKSDQNIIKRRVGEQIQLLRSVEPEGAGYYGHVNYQGWDPLLPHLVMFNAESLGPYDTYEDFITAYLDSYKLRLAIGCAVSEYYPREVEFFLKLRQVLSASKNRKPVMTHYDLQWRNMIVTPIGKNDEGEAQDWKVALIDWDGAGWAPEYMQKVALDEALKLPNDEPGYTVAFSENDYKDEYEVLTAREIVFRLF